MKRECGSTLPLLVGLGAFALAVTLTLSEVLSLHQQSLRASSEARFAALLIAKETAGAEPLIGFDYSTAITAEFAELDSLKVVSLDGRTFEATACLRWVSPLKIRPAEVVCQSAKSRLFRLPTGPMV